MRSRSYLLSLGNVSEKRLSAIELGGKHSVENRGAVYFGRLTHSYPIHTSSFKKLHGRSRASGLEVDFPYSMEGLVDFILYIGPVPTGMVRPTVGRRDHDRGYVRGNFRWQEHSENSSESGKRNAHKSATFVVGTSNRNSKFTNFDIRRIRKLFDRGMSNPDIASIFSVDRKTIYGITSRRSYTNVR